MVAQSWRSAARTCRGLPTGLSGKNAHPERGDAKGALRKGQGGACRPARFRAAPTHRRSVCARTRVRAPAPCKRPSSQQCAPSGPHLIAGALRGSLARRGSRGRNGTGSGEGLPLLGRPTMPLVRDHVSSRSVRYQKSAEIDALTARGWPCSSAALDTSKADAQQRRLATFSSVSSDQHIVDGR